MLTNVQENEYLRKSLLLAHTLMTLVLDLTQMVLVVRKHLQMTNIIMLDNFNYYNFLREPILFDVLPMFYTLVSLVMDLAQMVLAVQKHHQMTNIIMLNNFEQQLSHKINAWGSPCPWPTP